MELSRRTILQAGPALGAAVALPAEALGAPVFEGAALAAGLRARWAEQSTAFLEGVLGQSAADAPPALRVIGAGVGALDVVKELELLDTRTQALPALQRLWREVLAATGRCGRVGATAVDAWLAPGGDAGDPEGRHVRGMLGALRIGLRGAQTRPSRKAQMDAALAGVLDDDRPGQLRAHARRLLRRTRKAEVLTAHLAADPDAFARTFTLDPQRAAALGVPVEALAAQVALAPTAPAVGGAEPDAADVTLGMIGTGAVIVLGLVLGVIGLCATACGAGAVGVPLMLLGAVLVILAGSRVGTRRHGAAEAPAPAGPPPPHTCPPCPECPPTDPLAPAAASGAAPPPPADPGAAPDAPGADPAGAQGLLPGPAQPIGWLSVPADAGWVAAPPMDADQDQIVLAWGLVQTARSWPADPDGDGVAAGPGAPLPGAPAGALVGRVGAQTFFLGAEGLVPRGAVGPLLLAVNLSPAAAASARGGVEVQLLQRARGAADA